MRDAIFAFQMLPSNYHYVMMIYSSSLLSQSSGRNSTDFFNEFPEKQS